MEKNGRRGFINEQSRHRICAQTLKLGLHYNNIIVSIIDSGSERVKQSLVGEEGLYMYDDESLTGIKGCTLYIGGHKMVAYNVHDLEV